MATFCSNTATEYNIKFRISHLNLDTSLANLEAIARKARYAEFESGLNDSDFLLTAHHADDQAETLFLNLLRGSGSRGLRGIAQQKKLSKITVLRPLLDISRDTIENYANRHSIEWFEDPSNLNSRFDRNFIRLQIIPVLKRRWPGLQKAIGRVCRIQAENQQILDEIGEEDHRRCCAGRLRLDKSALLKLSSARQKNVLKYWLMKNHLGGLPNGRLESLIKQLESCPGALPKIQGNGYDIRIYGDRVYVVKPNHAANLDVSRDEVFAYLQIEDKGQQIRLALRSMDLPPAREKHRLKRLFQRHRIPPWLRDQTPLIFVDDVLTDLFLPADAMDK